MESSPDIASVQIRSITELSDGSTNGVNWPLRARPSQATISATMENTRAKPHSSVCASEGAGASSVWSAVTASVRAIAASGS